jgi:hypothetical protein
MAIPNMPGYNTFSTGAGGVSMANYRIGRTRRRRNRTDRIGGQAHPAAAKEWLRRRTAGIRRSRLCPCSGSRCSSSEPGCHGPATCQPLTGDRCSGCSHRCSTALQARSADLSAAGTGMARSSRRRPSDVDESLRRRDILFQSLTESSRSA